MLSTAHEIHDLEVGALPVVAGTAVLVVDDDASLRQLVALRLELLGHAVETAPSVPEAIAALETHRIGAVVSDQSMSEATGLELLAYVKRRLPRIPFVLMTGQLNPDLERQALDGGAALALDKVDLLDTLPDLFFLTGGPLPDPRARPER
jgi:two-component system, NtrC family, response regulator GlrR